MTLADLVSYNAKHNEANREANNDGHHSDFSHNHGVEGPSRDPEVRAARARTRRNLMATLMLSQGTPMLLAGDEIGNGQAGNNNAYCQDGPLGWVDWGARDDAFLAFTWRMLAFRRDHPILRQRRFLHSQTRPDDMPDLYWWHPSGREMTPADWEDPGLSVVCVEKRTAAGTPAVAVAGEVLERALFLVFNAGDAVEVRLPPAPEGQGWAAALDTGQEDGAAAELAPGAVAVTVAARSVAVFVLGPGG